MKEFLFIGKIKGGFLKKEDGFILNNFKFSL